jgi:hypothetical protein
MDDEAISGSVETPADRRVAAQGIAIVCRITLRTPGKMDKPLRFPALIPLEGISKRPKKPDPSLL